MFTKIQAGEKVFVDGQEYEVVRVSNARFWVQVGDEVVKFIKTTGKEYGSQATRKATAEAVVEVAEATKEAPKPKRTRKAKAQAVETAVEVVEEAAAPVE